MCDGAPFHVVMTGCKVGLGGPVVELYVVSKSANSKSLASDSDSNNKKERAD